jgi:pyruvate/2-oxoglutarate dehydrogenase complex dihydrolipoamide dehydrogenase (E3) component
LVAAAGAAGLGARVALVERGLMGGDCLNVGCVPSKGVLRAARGWQDAREAADRFGGPPAVGEGDFDAAFRRMRRLRADLATHDSAERFRDLGVDVFLGHGRFTGPDTVEVDGRRLRFRRALVATGGRPAVPPIPGLREAGYLTNETVFDLKERPPRLAVVGAGPIGCELAQAFARLGSDVVLLDLAEQVLPREEPEVAAIIQAALVRDGVRLELGVEIQGVERDGGERTVRFRRGATAGEVVADQLLLAVGRAPNVEDLGLEAAGIASGRKGVEVDDRLRTSNRRVYAAGDVASRYQFTHVADAEARIVVENALFAGRKKASGLVVPWCTYTSPEVAHVGMTAAEARARGRGVDTLDVPLAGVDRARLDDEAEGLLRVHLEAGSDRILGATLVSAHAGESIGELTLAITAGLGLGRLAAVIHPYPTQAEVIRKAADQWRRGKLTPRVRRLFDLWFRLLG